MKNFLDLLDTNAHIEVLIELESIIDNGVPDVSVSINDNNLWTGPLSSTCTINTNLHLLDCVDIKITMANKKYCPDRETAVIIKKITIDGYDITKFDFYPMISYVADQPVNFLGLYLGFNGVWNFKTTQPFYQWLHKMQGHGWILTPAV
jgi:hypothetical protein